MRETSKMNQLRKRAGYDLFLSGEGIDIGCGDDLVSGGVWQNIISVRPYDLADGDANTCSNLGDDQFDFVYSSHCLEHMEDPVVAFRNWIRICRPQGYLIVAVPHEVYYEKNQWPSQFNDQHKWSFRTEEYTVMPRSIWIEQFLSQFLGITVIKCALYLVNFDHARFWQDQTRDNAICQIEFVVRKNRLNS